MNAAARRTLDSICDDIRAGIAPTAHKKARAHAALRDLAESEGAAVANAYRVKLKSVVQDQIALLKPKKSMRAATPTPRGSHGVAPPAHPMMGKLGTVVRREPGAVFIQF